MNRSRYRNIVTSQQRASSSTVVSDESEFSSGNARDERNISSARLPTSPRVIVQPIAHTYDEDEEEFVPPRSKRSRVTVDSGLPQNYEVESNPMVIEVRLPEGISLKRLPVKSPTNTFRLTKSLPTTISDGTMDGTETLIEAEDAVFEENFMCNQCGKMYCQRSSLLAHKKKCNSKQTLRPLPTADGISEEWIQETVVDDFHDDFRCQKCGREYSQRSSLLAHAKKCGKNPIPNPRKSLPSTSSDRGEWTETTQDDDFTCQRCGRAYCQRSSKLAHEKICGKDPIHQCPLCYYATNYLANLKIHHARKHKQEEWSFRLPSIHHTFIYLSKLGNIPSKTNSQSELKWFELHLIPSNRFMQ